MTVALPQYAKIKDRYCIVYLGNSSEYLVQLLLLRPNMEAKYPGIKVYIACLDEAFHIISGHERVLNYEELKINERNFSYIFNLKCNLTEHPVEAFMDESDIPIRININQAKPEKNRCVIMPSGAIPTRSMSSSQIDKCKQIACNRSMIPEVCNDIKNASLVMSVENEYLFAAIAHGIPTALVPNGLGTNLYRKMLANAEVLDVGA